MLKHTNWISVIFTLTKGTKKKERKKKSHTYVKFVLVLRRWIVLDVIAILFRIKNLNILNKRAIRLAYFLFHNKVVINGSKICSGWVAIS